MPNVPSSVLTGDGTLLLAGSAQMDVWCENLGLLWDAGRAVSDKKDRVSPEVGNKSSLISDRGVAGVVFLLQESEWEAFLGFPLPFQTVEIGKLTPQKMSAVF